MNKKGIGAIIGIAIMAGVIGGTSMNVALANHGGLIGECRGSFYDPATGECVTTCPFGVDETGTPHCNLPTTPPPPEKVNTICPQENVQHWDKIIFKTKLKGNENRISIPNVPVSDLTEGRTHDIKILDDPDEVIQLENTVANKLTEKGYLVEKQAGQNILHQAVSGTNIEIIDVEYAIACISNAEDPQIPPQR